MDRKNIDLAAHLLAKAQRTDFDPKAIALIEKSYALLAKVITAFDEAADPRATDPGGANAASCGTGGPRGVSASSGCRAAPWIRR